jgi:hypothetical protein
MFLFAPLRFTLGVAALAAGVVLAATAYAGSNSGAPSLAEYVKAICSAAFSSASPEEAPFLSETIDAMTRMLVGMQINPSGDADRDFAAMMVAHHQGAIGMAQAELRYGHNEQLRRLAQEIIVTQQQEIEVMRHLLETPLPTTNR